MSEINTPDKKEITQELLAYHIKVNEFLAYRAKSSVEYKDLMDTAWHLRKVYKYFAGHEYTSGPETSE